MWNTEQLQGDGEAWGGTGGPASPSKHTGTNISAAVLQHGVGGSWISAHHFETKRCFMRKVPVESASRCVMGLNGIRRTGAARG